MNYTTISDVMQGVRDREMEGVEPLRSEEQVRSAVQAGPGRYEDLDEWGGRRGAWWDAVGDWLDGSASLPYVAGSPERAEYGCPFRWQL